MHNHADRAEHRVTLTERGPFLSPACSCGWYGAARRSRPLARSEAAEHLATVHGDRSATRDRGDSL
ncbi:hypothetical protein ACTWP5_03930 [Streptomyces sp. 4N509B]|uniref:hypothetical protein n=1 Tax=Streptomyces sp. 4N509B TaxID=3457413 RepID=UPI003FD6A1EB